MKKIGLWICVLLCAALMASAATNKWVDTGLVVDNSDYVLYVNATTNKVGIGTNAPTTALTVDGSLNITGSSKVYTPEICIADSCRTTWPSTGVITNGSTFWAAMSNWQYIIERGDSADLNSRLDNYEHGAIIYIPRGNYTTTSKQFTKPVSIICESHGTVIKTSTLWKFYNRADDSMIINCVFDATTSNSTVLDFQDTSNILIHNIKISGREISDAGDLPAAEIWGIYFHGNETTSKFNIVQFSEISGEAFDSGVTIRTNSNNNKIVHNYIHDIGTKYTSGSVSSGNAIELISTGTNRNSENTISDNTIKDSFTYGVRVVGCQKCSITENKIYNINHTGIILTLQTNDTIVEGNHITNATYGVTIGDSAEDNSILMNRLFKCRTSGITVENGAGKEYLGLNYLSDNCNLVDSDTDTLSQLNYIESSGNISIKVSDVCLGGDCRASWPSSTAFVYNTWFNQKINTSSAVTFATIDTGQGANELYDMDQNVLKTSNPVFAGVNLTKNLVLSGILDNTLSTTQDQIRRNNTEGIIFDSKGGFLFNIDTNSNDVTTGFKIRANAGSGDIFSVTQTGAASMATLNTGQGAYELYAMNQDVETTDAVTFATIDTGQGANELYDMDQNVLKASSVLFNRVNATTNICLAGVCQTSWPASFVFGTWFNQKLNSTSAPTFTTLNTGQGAYELYAMNQDVETTDAVAFAGLNVSGKSGISGVLHMSSAIKFTNGAVINITG